MTARRQTWNRQATVVAVVLLASAAAACGGGVDDEENTNTNAARSTDAGSVVIELVAFKPERLSVQSGAKVIWRQNDTGDHTVTSGAVEQAAAGVTQQPDGRFDSGEFSKGETFEFTFTETGTYPYFCRLHPATMRGEIHVR